MRVLSLLFALSICAAANAAPTAPAPTPKAGVPVSCDKARGIAIKASSSIGHAKTWDSSLIEAVEPMTIVALGSFVGDIELGYSRHEGGAVLVCAFDLSGDSKWAGLASEAQLRVAGESKLRVPFGPNAKHVQAAKLIASGEPVERMLFVWKEPAVKVSLKPAKLDLPAKKARR